MRQRRPIKTVNIVHAVINEHGSMFDELIELVVDCLTGAGIQANRTTNHVVPDQLNIIIGSTVFFPPDSLARIQQLPKGYIVFQLEALDSEHGHASASPAYIELLRGAEQTWDYSPQNAQYLAALGLANVRYIPLGYSHRLDRIKDADEQDIDILFYGSASPRRSQIIAELSAGGARVVSLFGKYGPDRDAYIARAKLALNIHCFETAHLEQVRLSYLLNNKRFVVSETPDSDPYGDGVVFCRYHDLVATCAHYLKPKMASERMRIAELGYKNLQQIPMAHSIVEALAELA